ncbi:MAG: hypothetical protein Q8M31_00835 [Beijerinckiaceae bacterium]|nr:hypothetical protein [Beijerinckiaceae bacterium]
MIRASLFALVLAVLSAISPVQAQRGDCEKLKDAHAYNNCIAVSGPASRAGSGAAPRPRAQGAQPRTSSRRAVRSQQSMRGGVTLRRLPNGRMRMEIPSTRRR